MVWWKLRLILACARPPPDEKSWKCKNPFQSNEKCTEVHLRRTQNKVEWKSFEAAQYSVVFSVILESKLNKAKYCYVIMNFHSIHYTIGYVINFPFLSWRKIKLDFTSRAPFSTICIKTQSNFLALSCNFFFSFHLMDSSSLVP